jgi:hypothetical protein
LVALGDVRGLGCCCALVGLVDDDDGVLCELRGSFVALGEGFQQQGAGFCVLGSGGGGHHELVSVVDHPPPQRIALVVAAVDEDQPVVLRGDLVDGVDVGRGEALLIGQRHRLGPEYVVLVGGLVVHEVRQIGALRTRGHQVRHPRQKIEQSGLVRSLLGPPAERAAELVVVPREHPGAAVAGEHGGQ